MAEQAFNKLLRETQNAEQNFPEASDKKGIKEGEISKDVEALIAKAKAALEAGEYQEASELSSQLAQIRNDIPEVAEEPVIEPDEAEPVVEPDEEEEPFESKAVKEDQQPGKGPDKGPEMKGKDPQHSNVNEFEEEGQPERNAVEAAVEAIAEWIGPDANPEQIEGVLRGIAKENRNTDVVETAIQYLQTEERAEREPYESKKGEDK